MPHRLATGNNTHALFPELLQNAYCSGGKHDPAVTDILKKGNLYLREEKSRCFRTRGNVILSVLPQLF